MATFQDIWIPTNGCRGMLNWDGRNDVIAIDFVGVAPGDLLEIGDESEKEGHVKMVKCKGKSDRIQEEEKILAALAFVAESIANQCHLKSKAITK